MIALQRFTELHDNEPFFPEWRADENHMSRLGAIRDILDLVGNGAEGGADAAAAVRAERLPREVAEAMAKEIERKMRDAAANLEFEKAAALRDELVALRRQIGGNESVLFQGKAPKIFQHALKELIGT